MDLQVLARSLGALALALVLLPGCGGGNGDGVSPPPPDPPPPVPLVHPLDVAGQDCLPCHETWDFQAIHERFGTGYDGDCIKCHGLLLEEPTLDPTILGPHAEMMPFLIETLGGGSVNSLCSWCHFSTDLAQHSGANLRSQVDVMWCWGCHRESGSYPPVLYPD